MSWRFVGTGNVMTLPRFALGRWCESPCPTTDPLRSQSLLRFCEVHGVLMDGPPHSTHYAGTSSSSGSFDSEYSLALTSSISKDSEFGTISIPPTAKLVPAANILKNRPSAGRKRFPMLSYFTLAFT